MEGTSLRESEIRLPDDDPFKDDLLERKVMVESVAGAIDSFREPHVVAINGGYGTGKTTVLRFLGALLRQRDIGVAVLNAWEQDHQHPLESLLNAAGGAFGDEGWKRGLKEAAKVAFPELVAELAPPGSRNLGQQFLRRLMPDSPPLERFRRRLEAAVEKNDRVVFLVDELDRCRPDHAIGILEWSKHAFSIDGVHFVLGVHLDQLSLTVKQLYGTEFDGRGYLDRLIHMEVGLPAVSVERLVERELERRQVREVLASRDRGFGPDGALHELRVFLVEAKLSARAAIRAVALFDSTLRMLPEVGNRRVFVGVLTMMVLLKAMTPSTFRRFVSGDATDADVARQLEKAGFLEGPRYGGALASFQAYLIHAHREIARSLGSVPPDSVTSALLQSMQSKADEGDEHAGRVLQCEARLDGQTGWDGLGTLAVLKRVEWLAPF